MLVSGIERVPFTNQCPHRWSTGGWESRGVVLPLVTGGQHHQPPVPLGQASSNKSASLNRYTSMDRFASLNRSTSLDRSTSLNCSAILDRSTSPLACAHISAVTRLFSEIRQVYCLSHVLLAASQVQCVGLGSASWHQEQVC